MRGFENRYELAHLISWGLLLRKKRNGFRSGGKNRNPMKKNMRLYVSV